MANETLNSLLTLSILCLLPIPPWTATILTILLFLKHAIESLGCCSSPIPSWLCCCCSVMSNSLQPHGLHQARLPCHSPSPRVCSNSYPLSQWCHPTISSSVTPFSFLQSLSASGSFLMSWLFTSGGWNFGASASASVLPMNIQGWFPLGLTGLISLQSKGLSSIFSNTTAEKHQFFGIQPSLWSSYHSHIWLLEKLIALTRQTFVSKVMSLLFNMLSRLVITFLPRSKHLLISWLQSTSAVILEPKKIKSLTVSIVFPIYLSWSDGTRCHDLCFLKIEF